MHEFNRKIGVGVIWNLSGIFLSRGFSMVFTLLLARYLAPKAFGLIAMITVCFEVAGALVDSGLGQALIQRKEVSSEDLNTVFYTNLGVSWITYVFLYLTAPVIAAFYSQPKLTLMIQIAGLVVLINALKIVQTAVLSRKMNFKSQMTANTFGVFISGIISVTMAYCGAGVWSLVVQILSFAIVSTCILWFSSKWRPSAVFSFVSFKRLFKFGGYLLIAGITRVLFQNTYLLVIGRIFTAESTGLYFLARKLSTLVSQNLTNAVQSATFPALSTIQEQNIKLRYKYRQIIQLMMFLIAPIMVMLSALATPLIDVLFDEKWKGAVLYLQLFCIIGLMYPLHALNTNLLKVKGRSDLVLKIGFIKKSVSLSLLFGAIPFGITGIIISQILGSFLALIPNTYFSAKLINYGLRDQAMDTFKPIGIAILSGVIAWESTTFLNLTSFMEILFSGLTGVSAYLILSFLFKPEGYLLLYSKYLHRKRSLG